MSRRFNMLTVACAVALLASCGGRDQSPGTGIMVENAWVRLSAVPGQPAAGYFTIMSHGGTYRLEKVTSPQAERIELHNSMAGGGMMKMVPLAPPEISDGAMLEFKPGGRHAMLFGLSPEVKTGGQIRLSFALTPTMNIEADAAVIAAGDPAPAGN